MFKKTKRMPREESSHRGSNDPEIDHLVPLLQRGGVHGRQYPLINFKETS